MLRRLINQLGGEAQADPGQAEAEALALRAENQRLRLDLEETQARLQRLEAELGRVQRSASLERDQAVQARHQALLSDLAGPAAQFMLQLHLLEKQGKEIAGRDALAVARSLLRSLQNAGMQPAGEIGETLPYQPDQHLLLEGEGQVQAGQTVVVRTPGMVYHGQVLRKAGVARQTEAP